MTSNRVSSQCPIIKNTYIVEKRESGEEPQTPLVDMQTLNELGGCSLLVFLLVYFSLSLAT